jgi:hypothetical protein
MGEIQTADKGRKCTAVMLGLVPSIRQTIDLAVLGTGPKLPGSD